MCDSICGPGHYEATALWVHPCSLCGRDINPGTPYRGEIVEVINECGDPARMDFKAHLKGGCPKVRTVAKDV